MTQKTLRLAMFNGTVRQRFDRSKCGFCGPLHTNAPDAPCPWADRRHVTKESNPLRTVSMLRLSVVFLATVLWSLLSPAQEPSHSSTAEQPLKLIQTLPLGADIVGNFDHFGIDLKRKRLFATPEDFKSVLVFDLDQGKVVHVIQGIVRPHAVLYREDINRLYVTDGGDGSVKVYDGATYQLLDRIPLLKDADSIGYDISKKYLYVDNGGGDVGQTYSMLSVIDTGSDKKIADVRIDGDTLEAMSLDAYRPRLYVNDKAKNTVVVVDREKKAIVARWPITLGKGNVTMALDEQRQRLFVGCRDGKLVVLDTNTGKELQALPITPGVDDTIYDAGTKRVYGDWRRSRGCVRPGQPGSLRLRG